MQGRSRLVNMLPAPCATRGRWENQEGVDDQAVKKSSPKTLSKVGRHAILLVGAAHGVLSGQLAVGWLDGFCLLRRLKRGELVEKGRRRQEVLGCDGDGGKLNG